MEHPETSPDPVDQIARGIAGMFLTLWCAWGGVGPIFGHGPGLEATLQTAVRHGAYSVFLLLLMAYWLRSFRSTPARSTLALMALAPGVLVSALFCIRAVNDWLGS